MKHLVIYHKNCMDGLAAAAVLRRWLLDEGTSPAEIEFLPAQYGDSAPPVEGREVYLVDFSYNRPTLLAMADQAESLLVIDHHETAQVELAGLEFCLFDMNQSGAMLTWRYFYGEEKPPQILEYIQDRDLWQWRLPYSREVSAGLFASRPTLDNFGLFVTDEAVSELKQIGRVILNAQQNYLDGYLTSPQPVALIGGFTVPVVNSTYLISETGETLLRKYPEAPFVAIYFDTPDKRVFSLRTNAERIEKTGIKVNNVARIYGGGGHPAAAGFSINRPVIL